LKRKRDQDEGQKRKNIAEDAMISSVGAKIGEVGKIFFFQSLRDFPALAFGGGPLCHGLNCPSVNRVFWITPQGCLAGSGDCQRKRSSEFLFYREPLRLTPQYMVVIGFCADDRQAYPSFANILVRKCSEITACV